MYKATGKMEAESTIADNRPNEEISSVPVIPRDRKTLDTNYVFITIKGQ